MQLSQKPKPKFAIQCTVLHMHVYFSHSFSVANSWDFHWNTELPLQCKTTSKPPIVLFYFLLTIIAYGFSGCCFKLPINTHTHTQRKTQQYQPCKQRCACSNCRWRIEPLSQGCGERSTFSANIPGVIQTALIQEMHWDTCSTAQQNKFTCTSKLHSATK